MGRSQLFSLRAGQDFSTCEPTLWRHTHEPCSILNDPCSNFNCITGVYVERIDYSCSYQYSQPQHLECIDPCSNFNCITGVHFKLHHAPAKHLQRIIDPPVFVYPSSYYDPHYYSIWH